MAFPGELNIRYYRGDTYEFNVYPKKNDGTVFSLAGYSVKFTIAETRESEDTIEAYAVISDDETHIECAIRKGDSTTLVPGTTYVYDIEITKSSTPYTKYYTVLTGNITVTGQVTA